MPNISFLLAAQRAILIAMPAWIVWCALAGIAAPYRPDGFLLGIFFCTLILLYVGSAWMVFPLIPDNWWLPGRILVQLISCLIPFAIIVIIGHYLCNGVQQWLS